MIGIANDVAKSGIVLSTGDYRKLTALVRAQAENVRMSQLAERLADELERAQVLAPDAAPGQVVCMNCDVTFRNDATGAVQTMALVYPADADIARGRLSVLTPVGTALIGMRVGDAATWEGPAGQAGRLTVLAVGRPRE